MQTYVFVVAVQGKEGEDIQDIVEELRSDIIDTGSNNLERSFDKIHVTEATRLSS